MGKNNNDDGEELEGNEMEGEDDNSNDTYEKLQKRGGQLKDHGAKPK
jgi:hypothetical protein